MTRVGVVLLAALAVWSWQRPAPATPPATSAVVQDSGLVIVHASIDAVPGAPPGPAPTRDDFQITADGQVRPIEFFSAEDEPLMLVLLIDASVSFTNRFGSLLLLNALDQGFLPGIKPADRLRVGSVSGHVDLGTTFSTNRGVIRDAIRSAAMPPTADRYGPSPLWDGVDAAIASLATERGRRAILLITDGRSTGNRVSYRDVAIRAMEAGVIVNIVGKDTEDVVYRETGITRTSEAEVALRLIADRSGGSFRSDSRPRVPADRGVNIGIERLVARTTSSLHRICTLGFRSVATGSKAHTLEVKSLKPGLVVRARQGYVTAESR